MNKPTYISYATGQSSAADKANLAQTIISSIGNFVNVIAGPIIEGIKVTQASITERRQIIKEEIESFYKLDTNKNANLGFVIVAGVAVVLLIVYKFTIDLKKK